MTKKEMVYYLEHADVTVGQKCKTKTAEAIEKALEIIEQQRWHPISEEPPKKDEDYIITYKWIGSYSGDIYEEVVVSRYYGDGEWDVKNEVLAWQPLPQLYKAESEGEE